MRGPDPLRDLAVTLVESRSQLDALLALLGRLSPRLLAVDCETLGFEVQDAVSLLQLAVDEPRRGIKPQQFVIDCLAVDPDPLAVALEDVTVGKLVHSADFERERLLYHFGFALAPVVDTRREMETVQRAAAALEPTGRETAGLGDWELRPEQRPERGFFDNKLTTLGARLLDMPLDKDEQASDWGRRPLSREQLLYAAADVAVLFPLARRAREIGRALSIEERLLDVHRSFDRTVLAAAERRQRFAPPPDDSVAASALLEQASSRDAVETAWRSCRSARLPFGVRQSLKARARERWVELAA